MFIKTCLSLRDSDDTVASLMVAQKRCCQLEVHSLFILFSSSSVYIYYVFNYVGRYQRRAVPFVVKRGQCSAISMTKKTGFFNEFTLVTEVLIILTVLVVPSRGIFGLFLCSKKCPKITFDSKQCPLVDVTSRQPVVWFPFQCKANVSNVLTKK